MKNDFSIFALLGRSLQHLILHKLIFLFFIFFPFLSGCQKNETLYSSCLTQEEKKNLEYFFKFLMIRESGAYVLFGSKPLCETGYLIPQKGFLRDLSKGWEAWEKVKKQIHGNRLILVKTQSVPMDIKWPDQREDKRTCHHIILADVEKTAFILAENYDFFKGLTGMDFHPLEIVFDLENTDSIFWKKIFDYKKREQCSHQEIVNHTMANGLLYGFGKKSTQLFTWREDLLAKGGRGAEFLKKLPSKGSLDDWDENYLFWVNFPNEDDVNGILIPGFVVFGDDEIVEKYKKERKKIQSIYQGKDFLEFTLQQMAK